MMGASSSRPKVTEPQEEPEKKPQDKHQPQQEEEFNDDCDEFAEFRQLFAYHSTQQIPFEDPEFQHIDESIATQFKQFCNQQQWVTIDQLISNYSSSSNSNKSVSEISRNLQISRWVTHLQMQTYPTCMNNNDINIIQTLGRGQFGGVYRAEVKIKSNKSIAAYKKVLISEEQKESTNFTREFNQWKMIPPHDNIALLYGTVWEQDKVSGKEEVVGVVSQLHMEGSLRDKLDPSRMQIGEEMILKILLGVARGLQHLHQNNIVHRDLFARNILLSKKMIPVITDFGLARSMDCEIEDGEILPPDGVAPEVYATRKFTAASDIYSLGVLVWEMNNPTTKPLPDQFTFRGNSVSTRIAYRCCSPEGSRRPTLQEVIERCSTAIEMLDKAVKPSLEPKLLQVLNELNIPHGEKIAQGFANENYMMSDLAALPNDVLQKEGLAQGMARGDIARLGNALRVATGSMKPEFPNYAVFAEEFPYHITDKFPFDDDDAFEQVSKFQTFSGNKEIKRERTYPVDVERSDIELLELIESGDSRKIYYAIWRLKSGKILDVLYKEVKGKISNDKNDIRTERSIWASIPPHRRIAQLYGSVWTGPPSNRKLVGLISGRHQRFQQPQFGLAESTIVEVLLAVAEGLLHLHRQNIVHRDLCIRNVLVTRASTFIISNFESARMGPSKLLRGRIAASRSAFEVMQNGVETFQSDIYSLGVLVWEMNNPGRAVPQLLEFKGSTTLNRIARMCCAFEPSSLTEVIDMCNRYHADYEMAAQRLELECLLEAERYRDMRKFLVVFQELQIREPEVFAERFAREKWTLERLRTLPYDHFEHVCLDYGMRKGDVLQFALKLGIFPSWVTESLYAFRFG